MLTEEQLRDKSEDYYVGILESISNDRDIDVHVTGLIALLELQIFLDESKKN